MNESTKQDRVGESAAENCTHTAFLQETRLQARVGNRLHPSGASFVRTPFVWLAAFALTVAVAWPSAKFLAGVYRVQRAEHWLAMRGADVQWNYELRDQKRTYGSPIMRTAADAFGPSWVASPAVVELAHGDLDDDELQQLSLLSDVTTLRLRSNEATDKSLQLIAQLPNLRRLVLAGTRFTAVGLQQLREMPALRSLVLCDMALSDGELALLESSIPDVDLVYYGNSPSPVYRRLVSSRLMAGDASSAWDTQSEPSADLLFGTASEVERTRSHTVQMSAEIQS